MNAEIIEIGHGIAFTRYKYSGKPYIAVNKTLRRYDEELYRDVILHEMAHLESGNKYIDLSHELADFFMFKKNSRLFFYMLRHPFSFTSMFPFTVDKREEIEVNINLFMCILWVILGVLLWVM